MKEVLWWYLDKRIETVVGTDFSEGGDTREGNVGVHRLRQRMAR